MQISAPGKLLAALTILIVVLVITLQFLKSPAPDSSAPISSPANSIAKSTYHFQPIPVPRPQPKELDAAGNPKIPHEKIEEWLAKHNRDATSLLAAFRALGDTNYLNEAATNFPSNPQVELAVLTQEGQWPQESSPERRKWLNLFKNSSPSNSLANYLSAQNYFENGNPDAAVQELQDASGKSQFDAFSTESKLDEEDLYLSSGYSQLDAAKENTGWFQDDDSELARLKQLTMKIMDLQQAKMSSGDSGSAANLTQMGITLANQLNNGDSGKYYINQLVSMAIENNILSHLDPNTSYDFLGGQTPGQILEQNKAQKAVFRELSQNFQAVKPYLTDSEMLGYQERMNIYGQIAAMQWVVQQHPPAAQNGQQ